MKGDFLFELYKRMGNLKIWSLFKHVAQKYFWLNKKVTKILKDDAKLRKQVISLCCKIVVIIGYVKLIERRRNHECIR